MDSTKQNSKLSNLFSFLVLRLRSVLCVPELFESFSILFLVMADVSELHLVPNRCGIWSNSVVW
ncbi:hypothetical protein T12_2994 [Trichinella patagoniensis]|uniref:Uncharacterized protein n=1 Tax=Trichinella patagoniensis TaxID=990121 RepID=A0A0V0YXH8_9BILA|nr:hypothetical protein T12_2994 [Trichinella patagoniensis]